MNRSFWGFLKWWYPQITQFNRVFHYKPSILGYHYFRKSPNIFPIFFNPTIGKNSIQFWRLRIFVSDGWGKNQQLDLLKGLQSIEQFINARVYPRKLHLSMGSVLGRRALIILSKASYFVEKMLLNNGLLPTWFPFHGRHFSSWSGKTSMIAGTCLKPCFDTSQTSTYTTWIHILYKHT